MRTKRQEVARYNWLTPGEAAERIRCSAEHAIQLLRDGDLEGINVAREGAKRREYRIDPLSVDRFIAVRRVSGEVA